MPTQREIADGMIQQLRILDPSISAESGTPERMIIETVAQAIAESQVDLNVLDGTFDISSKFGTDLDNMLALLGFGRQTGSKAKGQVTFMRDTAATTPVLIKTGTTVFTPTGGDGNTSVVFRTTADVTLELGATEVIAPIEAIQSGTIGNVAANTITETVGTPVYGITSVTNNYPTTGGTEIESDEELKARFTTAGAFRNLAGTNDQYMSVALSTKSKKANVVGPISRYNEYVQVPALSDQEQNPNASTHDFTTALSSNNNAKHVYDNAPFFIVDDTQTSPFYYEIGSDFVVNIDPLTKNKGDSARNINIIDPTSTNLPTVYQPNVTFKNVYTGSASTKPANAVTPSDILLFEYSYMSNASRNDYDRNILNCVDVYVNNEDVKTASVTIPRPGNDVPTFVFVNDTTSAFHFDNFRRINEPGHRPVIGNVYTPLYNQPALDLPNSINGSFGSFIKGIHYWLVEEITDLYGTVRARNGIEWSSTIKSKTSADPDNGPYTGSYVQDSTVGSTNLVTDIPSSVDVFTTTVATTKTVTNKKTTGTGTTRVATLTIGANHNLNVGDKITVSGVDSTFNLSNQTITSINQSAGTVSYSITTPSGYTNVDTASSGIVTLVTIGNLSTNITPIQVTSTAGFSATGYILIGSEIIQYSSKTSNTFTVSTRAVQGTNLSSISTTGTNVNVLIEVGNSSGLPSSDTVLIDSEQIKYQLPKVGTSTSLIQLLERATNSSYVSSHVAGTLVQILFATVDQSITIEDYQYDDNIMVLQSALESNKQVTTDVLGHRAKVRYFKPDITVMYSKGVNKNFVNESIRVNLNNYFNGIGFGNEVQLSDILQTIHNVPGVDNVRWSNDTLDQTNINYSTDGSSRSRLTETNQYGDPIGSPVLDLVKIGDGTTPTTYNFYIPYLSKFSGTKLDIPTNLFTSTSTTGGSIADNTTYYYCVTAANGNGQTTKSQVVSQTTGTGSGTNTITISWTPVPNATGYIIYRSTSNDFTSSNNAVYRSELIILNNSFPIFVDTDPSATSVAYPPSINTATINDNIDLIAGNFQIQYDNQGPITIEFDDLIIQNYDIGTIYGKGDVVYYNNNYYLSLQDDNLNKDPTTQTWYWSQTSNQVSFLYKLNQNSNIATATNANNFAFSPSFDNQIKITYSNLTDTNKLSILNVNVNDGSSVFNTDFQIGDDELVALPNGVKDADNNLILSSVIKIRTKSQNTWNTPGLGNYE